MFKKNYHTHIHAHASMHYERARETVREREIFLSLYILNENNSSFFWLHVIWENILKECLKYFVEINYEIIFLSQVQSNCYFGALRCIQFPKKCNDLRNCL